MKIQTHFEEQLNALSHGIGAVLGIIGLILLIIYGNSVNFNFFAVFVMGLFLFLLVWKI